MTALFALEVTSLSSRDASTIITRSPLFLDAYSDIVDPYDNVWFVVIKFLLTYIDMHQLVSTTFSGGSISNT